MSRHDACAAGNLPVVGDRVQIVVTPHEPGQTVGTVRQVIDGALGIEFDGMPGMVHQWYVPSEVMVLEGQAMASHGELTPMGASQSHRYPQVMRAVTETPWAIRPEKMAAIVEMVALRARGGRLTDAEIRARIGGGPASRPGQSRGSVAILPLYGVLVPHASMMSDISGGTALDRWAQAFEAAVADSAVDSILIDVNSPGGSTDLVPETAAIVRGARGVKPIVAIANTDAASAGYWIAAQADEVVVTPSGLVGSIGVFAAHDDLSVAMEKAGIKTTLISAGRFKVEASPFEPLSDEARAAIQQRVDEFYSMFVADVARGRGVSADTVRAGYGEGRVVTASQALELGMVDRVDTFEATVARLAQPSGQMAARARSRATAHQAAVSTVCGPIPPHSTPTVDEPWDGPEAVADAPNDSKVLRHMHAWVDDSQDPDVKQAYKFPHHAPAVGSPANVDAVRLALSRIIRANIPEGDRDGVREHLQRHLDDFNSQAASSGLSFADEAAGLRDSADALVTRLTSLAEVERGRLTAAKREQLTACPEALRQAAQHIDEVLAATDPDKPAADALRERARFERLRHLTKGLAP